jgi:predicted O-methyltransferase YrrM
MIDIERALSIDGFMGSPELIWLAEQAQKHRHIIEIGSWKGRSTRALADNTFGEVYAVDTWKGTYNEPIHEKELLGKSPDWLLNEFKSNMSDLFNVNIIQGLSVDVAKQLSNLRFDMVFIDAGHTYQEVREDILSWYPLVTKGGLLSGHDYISEWPGVIEAVDELLPNRIIVADRCWCMEI